ncbi:hypothetical protein [Paraburkholderia sp. CNPSo 3281]|uniref:hypothetical protein n=1 Tax=Paraburkholderia sp. CNPSo 3281 TaxID=2940933 RepID=UPI0020B6E07E|nr:hypothetical protein [Paraburkholderia sp. CNPSo 3281]MCP3715464.1 hypothetical protein [Paraburkholderia sp. CNPSo 3281]
MPLLSPLYKLLVGRRAAARTVVASIKNRKAKKTGQCTALRMASHAVLLARTTQARAPGVHYAAAVADLLEECGYVFPSPEI